MTSDKIKEMISDNIPFSTTMSKKDKIAMDNSIENLANKTKDEQLLFAFWCSSVSSDNKLLCVYAVCGITDRRIIYMSDPGKGLLSSTMNKIEKSVSLKDINDVTLHSQPSFSFLEGTTIEIDTIKENMKFNFFRSKPDYATAMYQKLYDAIESAKKIYNKRIAEENGVYSKTFSVADELIKLKSLLDMEIITQEEFDNKKKELLLK